MSPIVVGLMFDLFNSMPVIPVVFSRRSFQTKGWFWPSSSRMVCRHHFVVVMDPCHPSLVAPLNSEYKMFYVCDECAKIDLDHETTFGSMGQRADSAASLQL